MVLARSKTSKGPVTFRSRTSSKATKTTLRVPTLGIARRPSGTKWLRNGMEGAIHNSQSTVLGEVHRSPPWLAVVSTIEVHGDHRQQVAEDNMSDQAVLDRQIKAESGSS